MIDGMADEGHRPFSRSPLALRAMTDRNVRRHAARMVDRLEPGEPLVKVESVTGPIKDGAVPDGPVTGAADTIAKRFRNEVQKELPWLLCVTDRRLLFTWLTARPIDQAVPLDEVLGLERIGRRGTRRPAGAKVGRCR